MLFVSAGQAKNNRARTLARKRMYLFDSSVDKAAATASQSAWMSAINLARSCAYNINGQTLNATRASGVGAGGMYYLAQTAQLRADWAAEDSTNVWGTPTLANSQNVWMRHLGSVSLDDAAGNFSTGFACAFDTGADVYQQYADSALFPVASGILVPDGKGLSSNMRIATNVAVTMNRSQSGSLPAGTLYRDDWSYAHLNMMYKKAAGGSYLNNVSTSATTANSTLLLSSTFNETTANAFGPGVSISTEWARYTRTYTTAGTVVADTKSLGSTISGNGFTTQGAPYLPTSGSQETGYSLAWGTIPIWDGLKYVFEVYTIAADATGDIKQNALCVPNVLPDLQFNAALPSDLTPVIAL